MRGDRLDRRAALVHGQGRDDRHLLERLQLAPGRRQPPARARARSSRSARPTTAMPTTSTTRRLPRLGRQLQWAASMLALERLAARPGDRRRRAGATCGSAHARAAAVHRAPGSATSAATTTGSRGRCARTSRRSRCRCYAVGGWADGYTNAIPRLLDGLPCPRKGLIGPWAHAWPAGRPAGPDHRFPPGGRCAGGTTGCAGPTPGSWTSRCTGRGSRSRCGRRRVTRSGRAAGWPRTAGRGGRRFADPRAWAATAGSSGRREAGRLEIVGAADGRARRRVVVPVRRGGRLARRPARRWTG